ncbi:nuclear transport factor 2 family protein [Sedimentitalea nanhaiensis]|uniref:SnoaL-like polyketide cyclase n=1 Tax=Sedimentitalea nanhaiensis TaxID=999627 RepID=A0A1I6YV06_9RHOB|nr:ester cyclase [Sedimentitalea nanhaiensis]SFT54335.1 SnoaL-like polyketide cyclase [Sedimentitalea nanhaiensis]
MDEVQSAKQTVESLYQTLDGTDLLGITDTITAATTTDYRWRGFHPFDEMHGADTVADRFWRPLRVALTRLQRREDIFFAGRNSLTGDGAVWVVSMGHLMGLFDKPWLGIRPTGKMAFLRYCEFNRVENGRIAETAMYFDIPHLMMQAGLSPFPPQTAAHFVQPGPQTHDGLLAGTQPAEEGEKTLACINAMISDLGRWDSGLPLQQELAQSWADDMIWWGPAGIGSTYTIDRYALQHSGPFRAGFTDRSKTQHVCRLAEGHYGGFFGWPNFTARPTGGFMGMPATDREAEFRVIDIYRRAGEKLAENWVFIDLLHFWKQQGVDILGRTTRIESPM